MYNKEQKKEYYEKNKEKILEKAKEKITCECGVICCRGRITRHKKSWTHNFILSSLNNEKNNI